MTVTGPGSTWSNNFGVNIGNRGTGTLTIADGGVVTGPIVIATNAGATGTLNIGAGAGDPAVAPGTLTAPSLAFGAGTGTLNFNHTSRHLRVRARDHRQWHRQCARRHDDAERLPTRYSGETNVERGHVARRGAEHVQPEFGGDGRARRNARSQRLQSDHRRPRQCRPREHGHGHRAGHRPDDDRATREAAARSR